MEFKEIIAELDKLKDTDDYKNYIGGFVTADRVGKYLETDDGKKFIQPILDKYHTKGLETWKTSSLPKVLDDEIKKRFPAADPKDIELANIKKELEQIKNDASRKDLTNKALKIATEKNLPVELIDYLIGSDEESTTNNLNKFETVFNSKLTSSIEAKLKGDKNYVPPNDKTEQMSGVEKAFYDKNPNLK